MSREWRSAVGRATARPRRRTPQTAVERLGGERLDYTIVNNFENPIYRFHEVGGNLRAITGSSIN